MARYDDTRNSLYWLEEELLAAEAEELEEEYEEDGEYEYEDEYEDGQEDSDDDDLMARVDRLIQEDVPSRTRATHSRRKRKWETADFSRTAYDSGEFGEDSAVFIDPPRKKGIFGYLILAILELLAILAIVRWWLQWL